MRLFRKVVATLRGACGGVYRWFGLSANIQRMYEVPSYDQRSKGEHV